MENTKKKKTKVQVELEGIPAELYSLLIQRSKSIAIAQAIVKLAQDDIMRSMLFENEEKVLQLIGNKPKATNQPASNQLQNEAPVQTHPQETSPKSVSKKDETPTPIGTPKGNVRW